MGQWEYLTVQLKPKTVATGKRLNPTASFWDAEYFSEQLNSYSAQGWELSFGFSTEGPVWNGGHLPGGTNGVFVVFKRKVS